jgi:hypothetical protein
MEPTQPSLGPGCQGILLGPDLCLGTLHGPVLGSCIWLATKKYLDIAAVDPAQLLQRQTLSPLLPA